jgi:hypothetical protein
LPGQNRFDSRKPIKRERFKKIVYTRPRHRGKIRPLGALKKLFKITLSLVRGTQENVASGLRSGRDKPDTLFNRERIPRGPKRESGAVINTMLDSDPILINSEIHLARIVRSTE